MLVYGYGYLISTYIDIQIALLIYCRICWTAITNKRGGKCVKPCNGGEEGH